MSAQAPEREPGHQHATAHVQHSVFARDLLQADPAVTDPRFRGRDVEQESGYESLDDEAGRFDAG